MRQLFSDKLGFILIAANQPFSRQDLIAYSWYVKYLDEQLWLLFMFLFCQS